MYTITRREAFSDTTFLWDVHAPDVARAAQPGHFVMLRLHEGSERIPLTVADYDRDAGTITMVVQSPQASRPGARRLLAGGRGGNRLRRHDRAPLGTKIKARGIYRDPAAIVARPLRQGQRPAVAVADGRRPALGVAVLHGAGTVGALERRPWATPQEADRLGRVKRSCRPSTGWRSAA